MIAFNRSISWRLIMVITLVMTVVLTIKGFLDYQASKNTIVGRAEQSQTQVAARLQLNLPGAMWNYADEQVVKIGQSELKTPYIFEIQVKDNGNKLKFNQANEEGFPGSSMESPLVFIEGDTKNKVGSTHIVINQEVLDKELSAELTNTIFEVLLVDFLLVIALFLLSRTLLTRPLQEVSDAMADIAHGESDLTKRMTISREDEIGVLADQFNFFIQRIQDLVVSIQDSIEKLVDTSQVVAADASQANQFLDTQQSETNLVATAITEMAASAVEVAQNAQNTVEAAQDVGDKTAEVQKIVQASVDSIGELSEQLNEAGVVISDLESDVGAIVSVVEVIRGVAEQTNLLALNAAIEAARAGEQGRGFAVVADEVRTLASRTQKSTEEINDMITKLQRGSQSAVTVVRESQEKGLSTVESVNKAGDSIEGIVSATLTINEMSTQIASAVEEQSKVSSDLDSSINRIVDAGQSSSSVISEMAQKAKGLDELAAELNTLVNRFKVR
ncbi:MAG: methyl-accepting chemotaxis protein [Bermanella sp.]